MAPKQSTSLIDRNGPRDEVTTEADAGDAPAAAGVLVEVDRTVLMHELRAVLNDGPAGAAPPASNHAG